MKDYYAVLGLPESADGEAVKKAFRKLALQYHPDKNPGKEQWAEAKFKEINEAYSVLSDPQRRREYDARRKSPFATGGQDFVYNQQDIFRSSFTNPQFYEQLSSLFREMGLRFDQDFVNRSFFNGGNVFYYRAARGTGARNPGTAGNMPPPRPSTGVRLVNRFFGWIMKNVFRHLLGIDTDMAVPDVHQEVKLSPSEAREGCTRKVTFKQKKEKKELLVKIPAGVKTGTKIRLRGAGRQGYRPGDLYLHVKLETG
jgi:DnaJ-class molecular chaperone